MFLRLVAALALIVATAGCGSSPPERESGVPFTEAEVSESSPGVFTVRWSAPGAGGVEVFAGTDRDHVGRDRRVAAGGESETREVAGLPGADRWWFALVPNSGQPLVLADRSLRLAGAPNFRDLGGYRAADGRWVRMGEVYRSDQVDKLTDADLAKLGRLGLRTVIDLRTGPERAAGPDRLPPGASGQVNDVLAGSDVPSDVASFLRSPADPVQTMEHVERVMVSSPGAQAAFRGVFDTIDDPARRPLVLHCSAGKDRTGWASASILTALGVPDPAVYDDYLRSNRYVLPKYAPMVAALPADQAAKARPLLEVRPEYLRAGFQEVSGRYGSFDSYLRDTLHVPVEQLRAQLLVGG